MGERLQLRYTLVQPPSSLWECGDCGAFVVRCSVHDAFHASLEARVNRLENKR